MPKFTKIKPPKDVDVCWAIPGLGVDGRVYGKLSQFVPLRTIEWKMPQDGETIASYAARMLTDIPPGPQRLLGYSFGGVVALEMKQIRPELHVTQISSLAEAAEKPFWLHLMKRIPLYQLARGSWRIKALPIWSPRYGIREQEEIDLLAAMFSDASDRQRMWSVWQLAHWQGVGVKANLRIHGDRDQVFPSEQLRGTVTLVPGGRHFMIWQQAKKIADVIRN